MDIEQTIGRLDAEHLFPLLIISLVAVTGTIISLVSIVFTQWRRVRERQILSNLVRDMMASKMSVSDIVQVVTLMSQDSGNGLTKAIREVLDRTGTAKQKPPQYAAKSAGT